MNNEYIRIDESAPIVDPMEIESRLNARVTELIQLILEVGAILLHRTEEEHARIKPQNAILRVGVNQILTIPRLEFVVEIVHRLT